MNLLHEAETNKKLGHYNIAVVALATLFNTNDSMGISPGNFFNVAEMREIEKINLNQCKRMINILSIGMYWNGDEYLLIFTFRLNYQLIKDYYDFFGVTFDLSNLILDLDSYINSSLKNDKNQMNAHYASSMIMKNRKNDFEKSYLQNFFQKFKPV